MGDMCLWEVGLFQEHKQLIIRCVILLLSLFEHHSPPQTPPGYAQPSSIFALGPSSAVYFRGHFLALKVGNKALAVFSVVSPSRQ